ncbi:MAG TPA: dihydrofolate reductase family protein [Deinococcales bacterium]|nr:dihydrofolate reductase family protein [Deinococcales bacterium]
MPARPFVKAFLGVSLDGFIAREDGGLDWLEAGPPDPPELTGYADLMVQADTLVLGRGTCDTVLGFAAWPFPGKRVVVLTHRPLDDARVAFTHAGTLAPLLDNLAGRGSRFVYLDGGQAVRQALEERLLDELTLTLVPVTLGRGRPLFGPSVPERRWELAESATLPSGLVRVTYRPA